MNRGEAVGRDTGRDEWLESLYLSDVKHTYRFRETFHAIAGRMYYRYLIVVWR
jgi:hypothetical protein